MSTLHRMSTAQLPAVLALLADSGGTPRTSDSWRQDQMTALLLGAPETPTAVMPMACRAIPVCPGRNVNAGWLSSNQFASRMGLRRQTRDSAAEWPALLPELDALLVMRRDEPSRGWSGGGTARWYSQTGFCDVLAIRCLYLDMEAPPTASAPQNSGRYQVQVITPDPGQWDAVLWQGQMMAVYRDVYGASGGAVARHENFWQNALAHHFYRAHYQFQIIGLWTSAADGSQTLQGYAVVGWSGWHSKRPRMDILELATRQWDTAVAGDLIRTTCQLAWSKNVKQVRAVVSVHDPYRGHLARTGFADRWGYLMQARWLNAQRYLDALSAALPRELGDFWLELAPAGQVPLELGRGTRSAPARSIALRGTPAAMTRLLLCRTDLTAALQDGSLQPTTATALSDADIARLSHCFPWTPWVFHMLDYI